MCKKHCDMLGKNSKTSDKMGIPVAIIQNTHTCKQETRRHHTKKQLHSANKRASGGVSVTGSVTGCAQCWQVFFRLTY